MVAAEECWPGAKADFSKGNWEFRFFNGSMIFKILNKFSFFNF